MNDRHSIPLAAYSFGALKPEEAEAIDEHLLQCDECQRELSELQAMQRLLGQLPPESFIDSPPVDRDQVLSRTLDRIRATRTPVTAPRGPRPPIWITAAALLLALVITALVFLAD